MPMRIVAVHDTAPARYWTIAQREAAGGGFSAFQFSRPGDLIGAIQGVLAASNHDCLEYLEIVAHGDPTRHDDIVEATASVLGAVLKTLNLCDVCELYHTGCNTAINLPNKNSIAQLVSAAGPTIADDNVMLTVYGTVGYMRGMHYRGRESTKGNRGGKGSQSKLFIPGYPDAPDARGGPSVNIGSYAALGDACWRAYREGRRVK